MDLFRKSVSQGMTKCWGKRDVEAPSGPSWTGPVEVEVGVSVELADGERTKRRGRDGSIRRAGGAPSMQIIVH